MGLPIQIDRFEDAVRTYEQHIGVPGSVLLYGSSFFANWGYERARRQWAEASGGALQIINHGFGGATVDELLYYYHRLVRPLHPSAIVCRFGINDICRGLTAEEAMFLTERFVHWAKADNPDIKLVFIGIFDVKKPSPEQMTEMRRYNAMLEDYCEEMENLTYLDINPFFYEKETDMGILEKQRDVFLPDGLHLTDEGYQQMAIYLAPKVRDILQEA